MTTVAALIELLKEQPQDAIIRVVDHKTSTGYYDQGGYAAEVYFDESLHLEFTKWPDGDKWLLLGIYNG